MASTRAEPNKTKIIIIISSSTTISIIIIVSMIRWKDAAFTVHVGVSGRDSLVSLGHLDGRDDHEDIDGDDHDDLDAAFTCLTL